MPRAGSSDAASAGLGTALIFGVSIAIAALGAVFLLRMAADLSSKTDESTAGAIDVSGTGVAVVQFLSEQGGGGYTQVRELVKLKAGWMPVDLARTVITIRSEKGFAVFVQGTEPGRGVFTVRAERDVDASFNGTAALLTEGDLAEIRFDLAPFGLDVRPREPFIQAFFTPEAQTEAGDPFVPPVRGTNERYYEIPT